MLSSTLHALFLHSYDLKLFCLLYVCCFQTAYYIFCAMQAHEPNDVDENASDITVDSTATPKSVHSICNILVYGAGAVGSSVIKYLGIE